MTVLTSLNITVPEGSSDHGDPHLLCTPATALNIIVFFLGNYFTHAGTVLARPGASAMEQFIVVVMALAFPGSGLIRACTVLYRFLFMKPLHKRLRQLFNRSRRGQTQMRDPQEELRTAALAGALCTLVRTKNWRPELPTSNGELGTIEGCVVVQKKVEASGEHTVHSNQLEVYCIVQYRLC
jgi:hypothetical protein